MFIDKYIINNLDYGLYNINSINQSIQKERNKVGKQQTAANKQTCSPANNRCQDLW